MKPEYAEVVKELEKRLYDYFDSFEIPDTPTVYDFLILLSLIHIFKVNALRTLASPYKKNEKEEATTFETIYYLLVNMKDLPENIPLDAVSYTHLDVYKRQVLARGYSCTAKNFS